MTVSTIPSYRGDDPDDGEHLARLIAAMVVGQLGGPERDCWWETQQVMTYTGHGRTLVATACAEGELHSHQRGRQGKRYTKRSVVDAWMQNATPAQQAHVCGCTRFTNPVKV